MCYVFYGDDLSLLCYTILAMMVAFPHVAIIVIIYYYCVVFFSKMLYFILIDYYS